MIRERKQNKIYLLRPKHQNNTIGYNPEQSLFKDSSRKKVVSSQSHNINYYHLKPNNFSSIPFISPRANNSPNNANFSGFTVYQQQKNLRRSFAAKSNQVQKSMMELTRKKSITDKLAKQKKQDLIKALWKKMENQKKTQQRIQRQIARKQSLLRQQNQNSTRRFTNIQKKYQSKKQWINRNKNSAQTHKKLMYQTFHVQTLKRNESSKSLKEKVNFIKMQTKSRIKFSRDNKFQQITQKSNSIKLQLKEIYHQQVQNQISKIQTMNNIKEELAQDLSQKLQDVQTFDTIKQNINKMKSDQLYKILLEKNRLKKAKFNRQKTNEKSSKVQKVQASFKQKIGSSYGTRTPKQFKPKTVLNLKEKVFEF